MRINNNIPALNTHRLLNINTNALQGALERLSSGKRINRASDDAAGMAISQKMQAQVRGLKQASRNSLDGISLIQTAEGALNEVHEILQRMRELSVQASNGTNAKEDLVAIQNEINELTEEVDRIANTTEFNKISLLNRNNISEEDLEVITSQLKKWWLSEAEKLVEDGYGIKASGVDMEITFSNNPNDSAAAYVSGNYKVVNGELTGKGSDLVLNINLAHAQPINPENTNGGTPPQYVDRVIAHEMVHAIMASTMNFGSLPTWFREGTAEFIHGADERLVGDIDRLGGGISTADQKDKGIMAIVSSIDKLKGKGSSITPLEYSTSYVLTRYLDKQILENNLSNSGAVGDSRGIKTIMEYLKKTGNEEKTLDEAIAELETDKKLGFSTVDGLIEAFKKDIYDYASLNAHTGIELDFIMEKGYAVETDTGSITGSSIPGNTEEKNAEEILPQVDPDQVEKGKPPRRIRS